MYPPNVTAQHLGRMDLIYQNDAGNKNLKHSQEECESIDREAFHQCYSFFFLKASCLQLVVECMHKLSLQIS